MALELNLSIITENLPLLLKGAGITLEITALSVGLGLLIGMFVGVAKLSDNRLIRGLASVYVDCIRGTPLLVQIFLVYFALPQIIGHRIDPFVAAVGACCLRCRNLPRRYSKHRQRTDGSFQSARPQLVSGHAFCDHAAGV